MTPTDNSKRIFALVFLVVAAPLVGPHASAQDVYDVVIANGRVMDPETGTGSPGTALTTSADITHPCRYSA